MEGRQPNTTRLYNQFLEWQARMEGLKMDLASSIRSGDHGRATWLECRRQLRSWYEELVYADGSFVLRSPDLIASFWHTLYYNLVEACREERSSHSGADPKGNTNAHGFVSVDSVLMKREVAGLLDEGLGFFIMLIQHLTCILTSVEGHSQRSIRYPINALLSPCFPHHSCERIEDMGDIKQLLYKYLLSAGDLCRYRESITPKSELSPPQDCSSGSLSLKRQSLRMAADYYGRACRLIPTNGEAYNQIAVLATTLDDPLASLLYYLKASMTVMSFAKAPSFLTSLCKKLMKYSEEKLALSTEATEAALLGSLLRLVALSIVNDLTRNSQLSHLETVTGNLYRMLSSFNNPSPFGIKPGALVDVFACLVLTVEFLQNGLAAPGQLRNLSPTQIRLLNLCLDISDKALRTSPSPASISKDILQQGSAPVADIDVFTGILVKWMLSGDLIVRASQAATINAQFYSAFSNWIRSMCSFVNKSDIFNSMSDRNLKKGDELLVEDDLFMGMKPFIGATPIVSSNRHDRTKILMEILSSEYGVIVKNIESGDVFNWYFKEDYDKLIQREQLMSRLAHQRLEHEVSCLEKFNSSPAIPIPSKYTTTPNTRGLWTMFDSEMLFDCWECIQGAISDGHLRVIVPITTLRFLDVAKMDPARRVAARQIMRSIVSSQTNNSRNHPTVLHLQKANETTTFDERSIRGRGALTKFQKDLLHAANYFYHNPLQMQFVDQPATSALESGSFDGNGFIFVTRNKDLLMALDQLSIPSINELTCIL